MDIDHRDGDGLHNREHNLRLATNAQNQANSRRSRRNKTGFKGVSLDRASGLYTSFIMHDGVHHYLGKFPTPEEAHAAYTREAQRLKGAFARV